MIDFSLKRISKTAPYDITLSEVGFIFRTEKGNHYIFLRWFEKHAEPGRFTIRTANAIIEGEGFYAAIIVENRNPKIQAITTDFEETARTLTQKPT